MNLIINTIWRWRGRIVVALCVVFFILFLLNSIQFSILNQKLVKDNIFIFDLIVKICETTILIVGSILAYYKFFKGRTFSEKLIIYANVKVMQADTKFNLHSIDINIVNVGSISIVEPRVSAIVENFLMDQPSKSERIEFPRKYQEEVSRVFNEVIIQPQENDSYHHFLKVSKNIWAVNYEVLIESQNKFWKRSVTVSNIAGYEHNDK